MRSDQISVEQWNIDDRKYCEGPTKGEEAIKLENKERKLNIRDLQ